MGNTLLTMRYDGSAFHGWQVQKNASSVQETLQDALEAIYGDRPDVKGCSRTDSGVHANMYCVNFHASKDIAPFKLAQALNQHLPKAAAVYHVQAVPEDFHARYHCESKEYEYLIWNSPNRNPFFEGRALHYPYPLDADALQNAAQFFLGRHDFCGFCSKKSDVEDTVRTISAFSVKRDGELMRIRVQADGFLYHMVRILVGTLLSVAQGRIEAGCLPEIIGSGDRLQAGQTAPAHGLYLNRVCYEKRWTDGQQTQTAAESCEK